MFPSKENTASNILQAWHLTSKMLHIHSNYYHNLHKHWLNTVFLVIWSVWIKENERLKQKIISKVIQVASVVSRSLTDGWAIVKSLTSCYCLPLREKANFLYVVFFSIYFYFSHLTLCRVRKHCALVSCLRFNAIAQWKIPNITGPKLRTHVILVPRCSCLNNTMLSSLQRKSPENLKPVLYGLQK